MKELVTKERVIDCETIEISQTCDAVITKNTILMNDDLRAFAIPCTIGLCTFAKALCDLCESINLMPLMIFYKIGLDEPKPRNMRLLMTGHWLVYDVLVKVDEFEFPTDFEVLYCEVDIDMLVIRGRPCLVTGKPLVDMEGGELKF